MFILIILWQILTTQIKFECNSCKWACAWHKNLNKGKSFGIRGCINLTGMLASSISKANIWVCLGGTKLWHWVLCIVTGLLLSDSVLQLCFPNSHEPNIFAPPQPSVMMFLHGAIYPLTESSKPMSQINLSTFT